MTFDQAERLLAWAKSHDWADLGAFVTTAPVGYAVAVWTEDCGHCDPDETQGGLSLFYSVRRLRDWAGY